MRILFVHPNYRSGGAEIAGTWPPAWVAYLTGHLRQAGFDDVAFIDANDRRYLRRGPRRADRRGEARRRGRDGDHAVDLPGRGGAAHRLRSRAGCGADARRGPRDLHVQAGSLGGSVGGRDRARRGRGDLHRADARHRGRALARRPPPHPRSRLPRRRRDRRPRRRPRR